MKPLSLLLLFVLVTVIAAKGQDTINKKHPKPEPGWFLHNLLLRPDQRVLDHKHQDSLLHRSIPAEGHHPAIYADFGFGYAFLGVHGIQGNYSLNYQLGDNLFTFRGLTVASYRPADNPYKKLVIFDDVETNSLVQYALLYGRRIVNRPDQQAFNISAGISVDYRDFFSYYYVNKVQMRYNTNAPYVGVPIEADYQWFSRRFGTSFGLKLAGDISRYSFASFGVDMGLGFHYKN